MLLLHIQWYRVLCDLETLWTFFFLHQLANKWIATRPLTELTGRNYFWSCSILRWFALNFNSLNWILLWSEANLPRVLSTLGTLPWQMVLHNYYSHGNPNLYALLQSHFSLLRLYQKEGNRYYYFKFSPQNTYAKT